MKVGIIGYGGMARFHHEFCNGIEGIECVAAYDIDPERVRYAEAQGLLGFYELEAFLASGLFDTVAVVTPNDTHCELACAAMRAGKHVICEKPVALNCEQLDLMIHTAKDMGVLFTVHQNRRWDKDAVAAKAVIEEGMLGRICTVHSRLYGSSGVLHGWRTQKTHGGGILYDWGPHYVDSILCIFGFDQVQRVQAHLASLKNDDVEDYMFLSLEMKSGVHVFIEIGTFILKDLPRWIIIGSEGTACIENANADGSIISLNSMLEHTPVMTMTKNGPTRTFAPRPDDVKERHPLPDVHPDNWDFYRNVRDVLNGDADLIVKPEQVRAVMNVIDKLFESATLGTPIDL